MTRARRGPLTGVLVAHTTSAAGNTATAIALPLHVLATGGGAVEIGVIAAAATVPVVVGGLLGGTLVDRAGFRRASVVSDLVGAVTIAAIPVLAATTGLPFWALVALVVATGLLDTPGQAARHAMLPELAAAAGVPLERATGWVDGAERLARLLGVSATAALAAALGPADVLFLDAVTFLASAGLVLAAVPAALVRLPAPGRAPDYWRDLREGWTFVLRDPLLRSVAVLVAATNAFDTAYSVVLPLFARDHLPRASDFGWVTACFGGGAAAGALLFGAVGHRFDRRLLFATAFLLIGAPRFLVLASTPGLTLLLVTSACFGLAAGAINPVLGAVQLERVPPAARARVSGVVGAGAWAAMPLGAVVTGFAVEAVGVRTVVLVVGCAYLLVTLVPFTGRAWRGMDRPVPARADVPG